jgi:DNA-binding transcriptional regulator YiaG
MEKNFDIREYRKNLGLSQKELAAQIGSHHMTISRWESGELPTSSSSAWNALIRLVDKSPKNVASS